MNTWTMHVENFGKITNADMEVAPMTLFVGDNNSGKKLYRSNSDFLTKLSELTRSGLG